MVELKVRVHMFIITELITMVTIFVDNLGSWREDMPNGYGKETFIDGSYYEGMFSMGRK